MECADCGRIIMGYPCLWCDYDPKQDYETYGEATSVWVNIKESK